MKISDRMKGKLGYYAVELVVPGLIIGGILALFGAVNFWRKNR